MNSVQLSKVIWVTEEGASARTTLGVSTVNTTKNVWMTYLLALKLEVRDVLEENEIQLKPTVCN